MIRARKIALLGRSGAGKSTFGEQLRRNYGFEIRSTGQICRNISMILFGEESKGAAMLVTDALRTIDTSIFLKAALRDADLTQPIVIDSVRFDSDVEIARDLGFVLVRVKSRRDVRIERLANRGQIMEDIDHSHNSETDLDHLKADVEIENVGDGGDMIAQFDRAIQKL